MDQSFGQRLATLRGERGWTQEELADAAGLNRPRISLLENDEVEKPRAGTVQKLAKALGVPATKLEGSMAVVRNTKPADPKPNTIQATSLAVVAETTNDEVAYWKRENESLKEQLSSVKEQLQQALEQIKQMGQQMRFVQQLMEKSGSFPTGSQEAADTCVVRQLVPYADGLVTPLPMAL
ncbi:helix-turn-helix domain-containing protein [Hymenobacter wooponensis]|uniref:Helix-turn-helix domain-containing protein n=1 Tax=Hymenobacter wooponensis TaxID=1525360 RepID=A0A4Z0MTQ3_9BACT|nr:helix-turn-helix transcriptional regulator [Hymenobacter wooponensis]TGD82839.1 helix-turn-helix domain-containing protein [Hymenobacter wooponensis]